VHPVKLSAWDTSQPDDASATPRGGA
jgi:hypothetical protein